MKHKSEKWWQYWGWACVNCKRHDSIQTSSLQRLPHYHSWFYCSNRGGSMLLHHHHSKDNESKLGHWNQPIFCIRWPWFTRRLWWQWQMISFWPKLHLQRKNCTLFCLLQWKWFNYIGPIGWHVKAYWWVCWIRPHWWSQPFLATWWPWQPIWTPIPPIHQWPW